MRNVKIIKRNVVAISLSLLATGNMSTVYSQTSYNDASGAKTWFVSNTSQISVAAPPDAAKTKAELLIVKQQLAKADEKKLKEIIYWNAGAPSYRWNQVAVSLISWDKVDLLMRFPTSYISAAVHDATVLAFKEKAKYKRVRPQSVDASIKPVVKAQTSYSYPCEHTVTASAAAHVIAYFFPEKADSILQLARNASQSRIDAGLQFPSDAEAGWKLGEDVARDIIARAKADGHDLKWDGPINKDPKKWTGPYPMGINITKSKPLVLTSADQFRPGPPPDFEKEMQEMKNYKKNFSSTSLAYYWANSGYDFWTEIANLKMFEYNISDDAVAASRIYATLHAATRDAAIATFDAKYAYWGIRPVQYDTTYKPLIQTPPFPGYPSGHALGASTSATVLAHFFPADAKYFHKLAKECADSRFYAGIHFRTDNEMGTQMGKEIGTYVFETLMKK